MRQKNLIYAAVAAAIAAIASTTAAQPLGVVVTELHRDPSAGNKTAVPGGYSHSFVEITNFGSDTFFLKDVFLTNGKTSDSITLFDAPVDAHKSCRFDAAYLPPGGVAVILPQNYTAGLEAAPASAHPIADDAILLTVNHKTLCGGLANDDGVALYKGTRTRIDSLIDLAADPDVYVSVGALSGKIVLSRKQPKGVSVVPASLVSGDGRGGRRYIVSPRVPLTPGRYESLFDGVFVEYSADWEFREVVCSLAVVFVAENGAGAVWRFYSHLSGGGTAADELGVGAFGGHRQYLLSVVIDPKPRDYVFEIALSDGQKISVPVDLSGFWAAAGSVRVTELFPRGGAAAANQPEWFELQNVSAGGINLNGWTFGGTSDTATLVASDLILPSGQFIVVTKDTAAMRGKYPRVPAMIKPAHWIALNNKNDTLCVYSPQGVPADMAIYKSAWFGKGWTNQSLERVSGAGDGRDSVSWALCDKPTPGFPGNAETWRAVTAPSMEIGPTPFRPNGKNIDAYLSIRIKAPPNCRVSVKILSFSGKILKTFTDAGESILWDGKTDNAKPAAPGPIYVVAEFTSVGGKKTTVRKNSILWR